MLRDVCEMVVGGRPRCNVISDVEYGGPSEMCCDMSTRCDVENVVRSNLMWNVQWWCDVAGMVWC